MNASDLNQVQSALLTVMVTMEGAGLTATGASVRIAEESANGDWRKWEVILDGSLNLTCKAVS